MYDVIVVGARCAGAPLAMLLARRGARVLLVDRATFPTDIPHGHFIHRHGPRRLRDWGLLDSVAARTPAVTRMPVDVGDFPLRAGNLIEDGMAWGYGPRRARFDKILVDAAVAGGAELRDGVSVSEYVFADGRVVGIRYDQNVTEAQMNPPSPQMLALRGAVRDRPDEATRMIKARNLMIDPATFFNPDNLARLLSGANAAAT